MRIYAMVFLILIFSLCSSSATIAADDGTDWKIHAGAMQAITTDGEAYLTTDLIVDSPQGPGFFQLIPDKVWYRYIKTPENELNLARFDYQLGESNNFKGSVYQDDDNTALGIRYMPEHWDVPLLDNIEMSGFIREGGGFIFAFDSDFDFGQWGVNGYGLETHLIIDPENDSIGETLLYKSVYPDGRLKVKFGYMQWDKGRAWDNGYWTLGLWGTAN